MSQDLTIHILKGGDNRNTMIRRITEQLNGDTDVLAAGWENLSTEDLFVLYSNIVVEAAE